MTKAKDKKWFAAVVKTEKTLTNAIGWLCTFWFIAIILIMLWQVISRFVLNLSVPWTDEASRYLWITLAFIGAGAAISENAHIEINIIGSLLKGVKNYEKRLKLARLSDIFRYIVVAALCSFVGYLYFEFTMKVWNMGQRSAAMMLPSWIPDAVITLGLISVILHCIFRIIISVVDHESILDPTVAGGEE